MDFARFLKMQWPDLTAARPQLVDCATAIGEWWDNGKTGDVLNMSMPTRFGKSLTATCFSVWLLLLDPRVRILRASYASDLAEALGQQVKQQYLRFFEDNGSGLPSVEGTRQRWRIGGGEQDNHAAIGIGGGITGFGFDIAIVDDTAKNMLEATSAAYSRTLSSFKESVLLGRLEGRRKILNVGTRWTVNDWFSMWPDAEEYILPAMVEGRSVCEAWKTTAELELERERVSDEVWQAQYMQRPTATGRIRLFEGWSPEVVAEVPDDRHIIVIDPSTDYGSDFFVCCDVVRVSGLVYICGMFARQRASLDEVAEWLVARDYAVAYIESNGAGASIADKLRRMGVRSLVGFSTTADKYSRASLQMDAIKNYLRISAAVGVDEVRELLAQADEFPVGAHDDLIDCVVMAFEKLRI